MKKSEATVTNFNVIENGIHKHIAVIPYHGKKVRGYAYCDPSDTYDPEFGDKLATLRCKQKVTKKRIVYANRRILALKKYYKQTLIENQAKLDRTLKAIEKINDRCDELYCAVYNYNDEIEQMKQNNRE